MSVVVPIPVASALLAHARRALPDECCGLLVGTPDHIAEAVPARNLRASPTRFLIDPADHLAALHTARRRGFDVIGAYHSHPGGVAVPSSTDLREANDPDLLHIIVAPQSDVLAAYRLRTAAYTRVPLEIR